MGKQKQEKERARGRRYFLTISRYEMGDEIGRTERSEDEQLMGPISVKEKLKNLLVEKEDSLSHYMIGEESHVDGSKHYHIYLKYSRQRELKFDHFDYLGKHGKLEVCRSPIGSYMYISKEDKSPLANFDYEAGVLKGSAAEIGLYLSQTGKEYSDLFKSDAVHSIATKWQSIKKWKGEFEDQRRMLEMSSRMAGIKLIDEALMREVLSKEEMSLIEENKELQQIIRHINQMREYKWNRPFKMKNLLIYSSEPNTGKTSLIRKISEYCPIFSFPRDKWFHGYKSNTFWGMLWNEVNIKGWDIEDLKNMLEGTPMQVNIKGSHIAKDDNPECFMTSNYTLCDMVEERYKYDEKRFQITLKTLRARIEEVNLDNFIEKYVNIFFLQKLIIPV